MTNQDDFSKDPPPRIPPKKEPDIIYPGSKPKPSEYEKAEEGTTTPVESTPTKPEEGVPQSSIGLHYTEPSPSPKKGLPNIVKNTLAIIFGFILVFATYYFIWGKDNLPFQSNEPNQQINVDNYQQPGGVGDQIIPESQEETGTFVGEWLSPFACTYYTIPGSGEVRYGVIKAYHYLKIMEDNNGWYSESRMQLVSYDTIPGSSLDYGLPPLVPAYEEPFKYSGPLSFDSRISPGPSWEHNVNINGNRMTVTKNFPKYVKTLDFIFIKNDPKNNNQDTLYVTIGYAYSEDTFQPVDDSDPQAIVLVRQ